MPKFDIVVKPGEAVPPEFATILNPRLTPAFRQKLLKHGGLIRLSVASPYVDRKATAKSPTTVDDAFMRELEAPAQDGEALRARLQPLPVKQLLEICHRLQLPVRSSSSSREIREAITHRLQSGHVWDRIADSGQSKTQAETDKHEPVDDSGNL